MFSHHEDVFAGRKNRRLQKLWSCQRSPSKVDNIRNPTQKIALLANLVLRDISRMDGPQKESRVETHTENADIQFKEIEEP